MLSGRVPPSSEPNAWSRAFAERRARGQEILDLTESNPTRVGLVPIGAAGLEVLADHRALAHDPDPRGLRSAREAIARYYGDQGRTVDPDHVILTSGTSEAYAHLLRLLCDPGDRILAPRPSYPLFEPLADAEGVAIGFYDWRDDDGWRLDLESFERAIDGRTRAAITVQPNHPTGCGLQGSDLVAFESICQRHGLAIVSDEVFSDYGRPETESLSLLGERVAPTFVLSGLSKVCGLPQMKLSWIVTAGPAADRERAVHGLEWLADLYLSVSTPIQLAAPRWLADRHGFQKRVRGRVAENLEALHALSARCAKITVFDAQGGWVGILRIGGSVPDKGWEIELIERGVAVHPGFFYDLEDDRCVVVSLIVDPETMREALSRLEALAGG